LGFQVLKSFLSSFIFIKFIKKNYFWNHNFQLSRRKMRLYAKKRGDLFPVTKTSVPNAAGDGRLARAAGRS